MGGRRGRVPSPDGLTDAPGSSRDVPCLVDVEVGAGANEDVSPENHRSDAGILNPVGLFLPLFPPSIDPFIPLLHVPDISG